MPQKGIQQEGFSLSPALFWNHLLSIPDKQVSNGNPAEDFVARWVTVSVSLKLLMCPRDCIGSQQERTCETDAPSAPNLDVPARPTLPKCRHMQNPCATVCQRVSAVPLRGFGKLTKP